MRLVKLIRTIKERIIGFETSEMNPLYDPTGITGSAAAKIIKELLNRKARNNNWAIA